ncbi:MAG: hypothetical protein R3335_13530 [Anaerolineales bacterium]|nr:hypothetical protein [Anaerolineales bacterium]
MIPNRTRIRQIAIIAGMVVMVLLVMDFNTRMAELSRLESYSEQVSVDATESLQTLVYLETQIAYATSDQAVEDWARVQARMIRPGDHPIIPLPGEGQLPTPTPMPVETPTPVAPWQVWLDLFFQE